MILNLTNRRHLGAVLAGLRLLQAHADDGYENPEILDVFTDGGTVEPLTSGEIEALCQSLNLDGPDSGLVGALQYLLDDLNDAGETHGEDGTIFDSVEPVAAALVEMGGALNWYSAADAAAFRAREAGAEPDLIPTAVRDIRPGDAVDLQGAPGCDGDSFFGVEFELAEVVSFEAETPDCIRLDFAELPSVGFDPATILPTRKGSADFWLVGRAIKGAKPGEPAETLLAGFFSEGEAAEFLDGPSTDKAALYQGEYSITGPADD